MTNDNGKNEAEQDIISPSLLGRVSFPARERMKVEYTDEIICVMHAS